ncbi:MAG: restriction endonuclease subunit S [Bacteroidales bacterium]|nr:restriction endonuclease subunit S [Bacteroidales bacterium]
MADGTVKCIDDEIPFDIPASWEWCRIKHIFSMQAGKNISASKISQEKTELYKFPCYGGNGLRGYVADFNTNGDFLIVGRQGALCGNVKIASGLFYATEHAVLTDNYSVTNLFWGYYFLTALNLNQYATATAQPGLAVSNIVEVLIPLPPIQEQKRIAECLMQAEQSLTKYEIAQDKLEKLNLEIHLKLKKSILQEAIQGKLVPQIASEGDASVLLQQIEQEKQKLFKEGRLKKKDLLSSTIFRGDDNKYYEQIGEDCTLIDEEIPFEIPSTWVWSRIDTVFQINPKNYCDDSINAAFIPMEKINAGYGSSFEYESRIWGTIKKSFTHFADGDVAFAKITPCFQNRKSMILKDLPNGIGAGTTELKVLRPYGETINLWYILYFLESSYFIDEATFKGTANQQRIISGYLEHKLIPIPPFEEQKRIAERITHLLSKIGI